MSAFELPPDDPWVARGYGHAAIEPGARPAVLVVDLQYVHRRYAEVTTAQRAVEYLATVAEEVPA